jgi:DNA-binding YbaB/EbfC family protein
MAGVGKLLKQAQRMQRGIAAVQEALATERIEVSHGGGAVRITVNGHGDVLALVIDPDFAKEGAEALSSALLSALQEATSKAREVNQARMQAATGGFSLPGIGGG